MITDPNDGVLAASALHQEIEARVLSAGTSFYAAMRLLPLPRRRAMYAIYAFCREIDDIADENLPALEKQRQLALWREEIGKIYEGRPNLPIAAALVAPVRLYHLRREDFMALIDGMAMDAAADIRAPDLATLDLYCARVASAVGHLSVRVFGAEEAAADTVAHHLGRALQLTNILRDLAEDAARGRLYLPRDFLQRHGIETNDPDAVLAHPALPKVCANVADLAFAHFTQAKAAMDRCAKGPMRPAAVMGAVYHALLVRLVAAGWCDPQKPVTVPRWQKLWLAFRYGFL